jgi:hypothetical protein
MATVATRFEVSPDVCSSTDQDGSTILSVERGMLYSVIGVGSRIWAHLTDAPAGLPVEALVDELQTDFGGVPRERIRHDVTAFLEQLNAKGIVRASEGPVRRYAARTAARFEGAGHALVRAMVGCLLRLNLELSAALLMLLAVDVTLKLGGFRALHRAIKRWPMAGEPAVGGPIIDQLCAPVDRACAIYPKHALCLQRSAVAACLLRCRRVAAEVVIGCRKMPFHGHAWVEVQGRVVNDKRRVQEVYAVLDRC